MRDIRFRAWNSDKNKMQYPRAGEAYISCAAAVGNSCAVEHLYTEPVRGGTYRTYIKETFNGKIMQFTGLYDCNGREIYEGDILGHDDCQTVHKDTGRKNQIKGESGVVSFGEYQSWDSYEDRDSTGWLYDGKPITQKDIKHNYFNPFWRIVSGTTNLKIMGNIYENKELIGEEV